MRDLSQDKSNGHAAKKRSRIPVFSAIFPEAGPQSGEIPPAAALHAVRRDKARIAHKPLTAPPGQFPHESPGPKKEEGSGAGSEEQGEG